MGMYHSTSGKHGFNAYEQSCDYVIDKEQLKKILIREDELRYSEEYQNDLTLNDDLTWIRDVTEKIQIQALAENGISDPRGLVVLRNARFKYKNDPTMNKLTVYMRQDRSTQVHLFRGNDAPDARLSTLDGKEINLYEYIRSLSNLPLVLLVGSVT